MMRVYISLFVLLSTFASTSVFARTSDAPFEREERYLQSFFRKYAPSVVFIARGDAFGSGFFVTDDGLIVTNAHVVEDVKEVDVVLHDGTILKGRVIERGRDDIDVALVRIDRKKTPKLSLAGFSELRVGSWVASIGHGAGAIWSLNTGIVSNIYPSGHAKPVFQTQIPLNPGSSGGPILARDGRVVGIVFAGQLEANNLNFGIKGDVIITALNGLMGHGDCLTVSAPVGVPIFVNGRTVGKGPTAAYCGKPGTLDVFAVIGGKMVKKRVVYPKTKKLDLKSK